MHSQDELFWARRAAARKADVAVYERVLRELLEASEEINHARLPIEQRRARLVLAQNSARNLLKEQPK